MERIATKRQAEATQGNDHDDDANGAVEHKKALAIEPSAYFVNDISYRKPPQQGPYDDGYVTRRLLYGMTRHDERESRK